MSTVNIFDMADEWNDANETFTAIKMDVTDTASGGDSKILDLLVGGSSVIAVTKDGVFRAGDAPAFQSGTIEFGLSGNNTFFHFRNSRVSSEAFSLHSFFQSGPGNAVRVSIGHNVPLVFVSGSSSTSNASLALVRDSDGALAQRFFQVSQKSRLYNTFTDSSNFERLAIQWNSNVAEIKPEAGGTGSARKLHISGLPTSDPEIEGVLWNDAGTVKVSAG